MIDIKRHGAKESGADIGPALLSALEEAGEIREKLQNQNKWLTVKAPIFIPSGVWRWETPVEWQNGVALYGEDQASTLLQIAIPSDLFAVNTQKVHEPYALKIKNLHAQSLTPGIGGFLKAKMANRSSIFQELFVEGFDTAFKFEDCFTNVMRDCTIYNCNNGVIGSNLTNFKFYNNKIENCSAYGAKLGGSETNTSTGLSMFGNIFQGNGRAGLYLDGLDQAYFAGNFFEGNNRIPLRRDDSTDNEAHIEITATKNSFNRRNGNLRFTSTFITQGYYSPKETVSVAIRAGEIVGFDSGTIRAFTPKGSGFYIEEDVTFPYVENITFEGVKREHCIFGPGANRCEQKRNAYSIKPASLPYREYNMLLPFN